MMEYSAERCIVELISIELDLIQQPFKAQSDLIQDVINNNEIVSKMIFDFIPQPYSSSMEEDKLHLNQ